MNPETAMREKMADGVVHAFGLSTAVLGIIFAAILFSGRVTLTEAVGLGIYAVTLILMLAFSCAYHMTPYERSRPMLRRFDQAAIFIKIAGTYTPLALMLGTGYAHVVLALVWVVALMAAAQKLWFSRLPVMLDLAIYVPLAWFGLTLFRPIYTEAPEVALLMVLGGVIYTSGLIFFLWERLRFSIAIWHIFVLAGTICYFLAISGAVAHDF